VYNILNTNTEGEMQTLTTEMLRSLRTYQASSPDGVRGVWTFGENEVECYLRDVCSWGAMLFRASDGKRSDLAVGSANCKQFSVSDETAEALLAIEAERRTQEEARLVTLERNRRLAREMGGERSRWADGTYRTRGATGKDYGRR
jgi:hypothetical protein